MNSELVKSEYLKLEDFIHCPSADHDQVESAT